MRRRDRSRSPGRAVGARILGAVEATFAAVGTNTNLGIILLCAPLAAAAERDTHHLRVALAGVLANLDVEDAALAFRAIVRACPGGLGRAERHDVHAPATVTLREAMAEAADRDRIARQYVTDFADVFALGLPRLEEALLRWAEPVWATLAVYLEFLAAFSDSHIVRKYGVPAADKVREEASRLRDRMMRYPHPGGLLPDLLAWDGELKGMGLNPGTSADLTVATLFVHWLEKLRDSPTKT